MNASEGMACVTAETFLREVHAAHAEAWARIEKMFPMTKREIPETIEDVLRREWGRDSILVRIRVSPRL